MTLGTMRDLGVQQLVAYCLNDACRHTALIDVSDYLADTEVPWFRGPNAAWVSAFTRRCSKVINWIEHENADDSSAASIWSAASLAR